MVAFFKRPPPEDALDARIAVLSRRAQPPTNTPDPTPLPAPVQDMPVEAAAAPVPAPPPATALEVSEEDRFLLAREEVLSRLTAELSRSEERRVGKEC